MYVVVGDAILRLYILHKPKPIPNNLWILAFGP